MGEEQIKAGGKELANTGDDNADAGSDDLSFVYDVPVTLHVQLGEASLTIGDILKCGKGSVIPLNQKIGDSFRVMLENRPLAEGEVVEAGDHLGIKITNILKPPSEKESESKSDAVAPHS